MKLFRGLLFVGIFYLTAFSQQFNQKVPFEVCKLFYDTTACFDANDSVPIQVGLHVTKLDESFRFCLSDQIFSGAPPIQVIIALDRSGSMRDNDPQSMRCQAAHDFVEELKKSSPESYVGSVVFSASVDQRRSKRPISLKDTIQFDSLWNSIESASNTPSNLRPNPPVLSKTLATFQGAAFAIALDWLEELRQRVPGMKQHIIMITDDGWFEIGDVMPQQLLSRYRPLFPANNFPKIHPVVLTGTGNPAASGVKGLANIKLIGDETGGIYIEDAMPATIVATLLGILQRLTPRMDKLQGVTMKNLTTGESHIMKVDSIPGSRNDYIISGSDWNLAAGDNVFVFEKNILMADSTSNFVVDTMKLTRSTETKVDILSINSRLICNTEWPALSFTAIPESLLVNETVNATVQIDPSFVFPYVLNNVSIKGFTTSNSSDPSILSLFKLDSNINNSIPTGAFGIGTPSFDKYAGAFGGSMVDGSFTTDVSFPEDEFSFDFWVKSNGSLDQTLISSSNFSLYLDKNGVLTFSSGIVSLKADRIIFSGVWSNIAIARKDGKVSIFINGLSASAADEIPLSGDQAITVASGPGFSIDELRFNSKSKVTTTEFGPTYAVAQVTGMAWTVNGITIKDEKIDIPNSIWVNNGVNFSITRSSIAQVILNITRLDPRTSWSANSNPVEFVSLFPDPVPVEAVVLDVDGNGFIDNIKFTIQDTSILAATMPSVNEFFKNLSILTHYDKTITFHPDKIERIDNKTFNVTLKENRGDFETGWKSANFSTYDVTAMASGAYTDIVRVVDNAGPVIAKVTFEDGEEGTNSDKLKIQFSEPMVLVQPGVSVPAEMFNYYQRKSLSSKALESIKPGDLTFDNTLMNAVLVMTNGFFVLPMYDSLQLKNAPSHIVDKSHVNASSLSRIAVIEGVARSIISLKPVSNPYVPGTIIPEQIQRYYSEMLKNKNTNVLLVVIKSTLPLSRAADGSFGNAVIYDCVGNIVQRDIQVHIGEIETDYGFLWNAKNIRNRKVNSGVYLAVVKVNDFYNTPHIFRVKLGIK